MKSSSKPSTSRRFKLGIGLAAAVMATAIGIGLWQWHNSEVDRTTYRAASSIADKLNAYMDKNHQVPASLQELGVTNVPKSISYSRKSAKQYEFCVTYQTNSGGGFLGGFDDGSYYDYSQSANSLYVSTYHNQGRQCQTVAPYQLDADYQAQNPSPAPAAQPGRITDPKQAAEASAKQDSVCSLTGFTTHYAAQVVSVATADGQPIVPTVEKDLVVTVKPLANPSTTQQISVGKIYNVFSSSCTSLSHDGLQAGDYITVFQASTEAYMPDAIADFSRQ